MSAFDKYPLGEARFRYSCSRSRRASAHQRRKTVRAGGPAQRRRLCDLPRLASGETGGGRAARAARRRRGGEARRQSRHDLSGLARWCARIFGMGTSATAVEKLIGARRRRRHRVARHGDAGRRPAGTALRDRHGEIDGDLASAPRLLRQLRHAHGDEGRRLEARVSELQGRAFSAHRPGRDHAGDPW